MSKVLRFAKSTPAVEEGFLAAGITAAALAAVQTIAIVVSWLG